MIRGRSVFRLPVELNRLLEPAIMRGDHGRRCAAWRVWEFFLATVAARRNQAGDSAVFEGLLWLGGLILLAVVVLALLKRWMHASLQGKDSCFTLTELRRLRDRGEVTVAE